MPDIRPPNFADLVWAIYGSERWFAPDTPQFRAIYRIARDRLFRIGIRSEAINGVWHAVFTPKYSPANIHQVIDAMLPEVAEVQARTEANRIASEARRMEADRIRAEERAKAEEVHKQVLAERLAPAVEEARKLLGEFGEFVVRKERVRSIIAWHDDPDASYPLGINELIALEEAIRDTRNKSSAMFDKIRRLKDKAVDWPEADVVDAIERLTLQDGDHASIDNDRGWNKPDSPSGHWAYAMLQRGHAPSREAAVRLGRVLVGKYAATQLRRKVKWCPPWSRRSTSWPASRACPKRASFASSARRPAMSASFCGGPASRSRARDPAAGTLTSRNTETRRARRPVGSAFAAASGSGPRARRTACAPTADACRSTRDARRRLLLRRRRPSRRAGAHRPGHRRARLKPTLPGGTS